MFTRTHFLAPIWLSFLSMFFALLCLLVVPQATAAAQAQPTTTTDVNESSAFYVDRTDDDATAQACTDAPNDCSLRGAIIKANQQVSTTIFLEPDQVYRLTIPPDEINDATTGDLNITADLYLEGVWFICIARDCLRPVILGGEHGNGWVDRILRVENGATVTLDYLSIGSGGHHDFAGRGGGILVTEQAHLTMTDCYINSNMALIGGGLAVEEGTAILHDCEVKENYANQAGGGIWMGASTVVTITESKIVNNLAPYGGGIANFGRLVVAASQLYDNIALDPVHGTGGALHNQGYARLRRTDLFQNVANNSGGAVANQNELVIEETKIYSNQATMGDGGALLNQPLTATAVLHDSYLFQNTAQQGNGGAVWNAGELSLFGDTLAENRTQSTSANGGGIFHHSGELIMVNSTLSSNRTEGEGGGLYVTAAGEGSLTHVTIAENVGFTAGGLLSLNPALRISNTLLAQNYIFFGYNDCTGSFTSQGYNLIARASQCTRVGPATGDLTEIFETYLGHLQHNGGATVTHALLPGNPAINAGSPDSCLAVDQRGLARPQGGRCDIGAFEASFYYMPLVTR